MDPNAIYLVWPYLIKNVKLIEQTQYRATKLIILNDFHSNYYNCLIKLEILPIVYMFELYDVMFFAKSLKYPSSSFCVTDYISFIHCNIRSTTTSKPQHTFSSNNYILTMQNFIF